MTTTNIHNTLDGENTPGIKGAYLSVVHTFPSEMAQNFWLAAFAFGACLILTAGISLIDRRTKTDEELKDLVYSLTPKVVAEDQPFYQSPAFLGGLLLVGCVILNLIFW